MRGGPNFPSNLGVRIELRLVYLCTLSLHYKSTFVGKSEVPYYELPAITLCICFEYVGAFGSLHGVRYWGVVNYWGIP